VLLVLGALVLHDDESALPDSGDYWLAEMDFQRNTSGGTATRPSVSLDYVTGFEHI